MYIEESFDTISIWVGENRPWAKGLSDSPPAETYNTSPPRPNTVWNYLFDFWNVLKWSEKGLIREGEKKGYATNILIYKHLLFF